MGRELMASETREDWPCLCTFLRHSARSDKLAAVEATMAVEIGIQTGHDAILR